MEPFTINLNQSSEIGNRYKKFLVTLAVVYFASSLAAFLIFYKKNDPAEWIFIGFAVWGIVMAYFGYLGYKAKLYFSADDYAVEYQFGFLLKTPSAIIWETVNKVKIGPTYIAFLKRSGRGKVVRIGWLPYAKVIEIKDKVKAFAESKGIQVIIADFNRDE